MENAPIPSPAPVQGSSQTKPKMNKPGFRFTKLHIYMMGVLMALVAIYGVVTIPDLQDQSGDVSVAAADGTLDVWGDCGENLNACKAGLTCVEAHDGAMRCSSLELWQPCDLNDLTCNTGSCIDVSETRTVDDLNVHLCSAGELNNSCGVDADCNEGLICKKFDFLWEGRCFDSDQAIRDNWYHCDDTFQCADGYECLEVETVDIAGVTQTVKSCSDSTNNNICDPSVGCSDGSTCISYDWNQDGSRVVPYCTLGGEGDVCNTSDDCGEGLACNNGGDPAVSGGRRVCEVEVSTAIVCENGTLYDGTAVTGQPGDEVCGLDQFYECSGTGTWDAIGNSLPNGDICENGQLNAAVVSCSDITTVDGRVVQGSEGNVVCTGEQYYGCTVEDWIPVGHTTGFKGICKDGALEIVDYPAEPDCVGNADIQGLFTKKINGAIDESVCVGETTYTCTADGWEESNAQTEFCEPGTLTSGIAQELPEVEDCGPLDVNYSEKVDLGDFDNLVRRWGDACI